MSFSKSQSDWRGFTTLVEMVRHRAESTPDKLGFTYLRDGATDSLPLTYRELDARARQIALLLAPHIESGDRVLINHLPGLDYLASFMGCLYAGAVAVPVYPPRFSAKAERLQAILSDCRPKVALTSGSVMESLRQSEETLKVTEGLKWLETDECIASSEEAPAPRTARPDSLAFLQYTSGSTSDPKGVMLSHANLVANLNVIGEKFELTPSDIGCVWLPPYHDMGLIGGLLVPCFFGFPITLLSPFTFLQRPLRWLEAISRSKATISGGPCFAFDLCGRRIPDEKLAEIDLSSWRLAFCGAEPIRPSVFESFSEKFSKCGFKKQAFYPCYGLAEATLMVTGVKSGELPKAIIAEADALEADHVIRPTSPSSDVRTTAIVSCGTTPLKHQVRIVNPDTLVPCEAGVVGEVWFSGPSVAHGYWGKPEVTQEVFRARIAGESDGTNYLRTGDLGFLWEGELYLNGRIKDLIIIRGKNFYPQDIELTVGESHPAVRPGASAAFAVRDESGERLVIIQELDKRAGDVPLDQVVQAICEKVLDQHGLVPQAVSLIKANSIPLTSSGKIQRQASRKLFLEKRLIERYRYEEGQGGGIQ